MMGATALYYVWASTVGVVSLQYYRGIAVLYSLVVPLLLYKGWKRGREDRPTIIDLLLALSATASVVYWMVEHEAMAYRAGDYSALDVGMGIIATIVAIEAARLKALQGVVSGTGGVTWTGGVGTDLERGGARGPQERSARHPRRRTGLLATGLALLRGELREGPPAGHEPGEGRAHRDFGPRHNLRRENPMI